MSNDEIKQPTKRVWITRKNFLRAAAVSAAVWFGKMRTGEAVFLEALIMIPSSAVILGFFLTLFTRLYKIPSKNDGKWGQK